MTARASASGMATSDGGGVHRFFEREMDRQAQKRRDMELDLRRAFANGEFELHYQPLVDIAADLRLDPSLLRPGAEETIARFDLAPGAERVVKLVTIPESGSNYPLTLTVRKL